MQSPLESTVKGAIQSHFFVVALKLKPDLHAEQTVGASAVQALHPKGRHPQSVTSKVYDGQVHESELALFWKLNRHSSHYVVDVQEAQLGKQPVHVVVPWS